MRVLTLCLVATSMVSSTATLASAQGARLPIAEGAWVKIDTACDKAFIAHVHASGRFGTVYF